MSNILAKSVPHNECFSTLIECVKEITDPRMDRMKLHPLSSIIILSVCAIIGGANSWVAIEEFGKNHKQWFLQILNFPFGIPSHDTINRVFGALNHKELSDWLWLWLESIQKMEGNQISLDGKVIKSWKSENPLTILRACATKCRLILGQIKVPDGTNEITAIPTLLNMLHLDGKIVTIDAIGTQKNIAQLIVEKGANYVLPIKGNQFRLYEDMTLFLDDMMTNQFDDICYTYHDTEDYGHGRHEIRKCWATEHIDWFEEKQLWKGMKSIIVIESTRTIKGKTTVSKRYFLSSLPANAQHLLSVVRSHWSIENGPHWSMDLIFEEDRSTIRKGNGPQNFALLRSLAYSLLKKEPSKISMKAKRAKANCHFGYLMKVLLSSRL